MLLIVEFLISQGVTNFHVALKPTDKLTKAATEK